ncbi:peptidase inhibitor family I36 protein [Actinoplanes sp. TRM 88003]|uniref:Peptidase inhibitor family I36 protein n=1 Tax=Paractinoplanes aksuensis TaxID=2939490 RepID=A0ABT1E1Y0_9ACTN|nr:peptidase inhibitor family I36 protein [Actinoplanes aksuensis]MCO8277042.1 peptidase inhibitor family I36 protein [Actinoplanes aksuensis]
MNRRTLAAGIGIAVAVTGSLFGISSPASAGYQCPARQVCFYQDKDRNGSPATLAGLAQGGNGVGWFWDHKFHNGVNLNDQASSVHNNTNQWLRVYEHNNFGSGRTQWVQPYAWANFTGGGVKNDSASSARFEEEPCGGSEWCV